MDGHWCSCDLGCDEVKTIISSFTKNSPFKHFSNQNGHRPQLEAHHHRSSYTNYVVRLRVKTSPLVGFIIKMATPWMQCSSNPLPASVERGESECRAYSFFHSIVPGCVPCPVYYDLQTRCPTRLTQTGIMWGSNVTTHLLQDGYHPFHIPQAVVCTEELTDHQPLSDVLLLGGFSQLGARSLGACLAAIHSATHVISVGDEGLRRLELQFPTFQSMINIIRLFHYERPFDPKDPGKQCDAAVTSVLEDVYRDEAVMEAVRQVKMSFVEDQNSLIHGDLHIDSIIAHNDDFKLVDAEFVRVGPCAYDVGLLLATLLLVYYRLRHAGDREEILARTSNPKGTCTPQEDIHQRFQNDCPLTKTDLSERVLEMCEALLEEYISTMTKNLKQERQFSETLLRDILAFAGCELLGKLIRWENCHSFVQVDQVGELSVSWKDNRVRVYRALSGSFSE